MNESDIEEGLGVIVRGYNLQGVAPNRFDKVYYIKNKISDTIYSVESKYGTGGISGVEISSMKITTEAQKINSIEGFIFLSKKNIEMGFITRDVEETLSEQIEKAKADLEELQNLSS